MRKSALTAIVAVITAGVLATAAFAATSNPTVSLHKTAVGRVLAGRHGRTVYLFTADKGAKSTCYGQCAGDIHGQGVVHFGGAWWVVSSAGAKITSKP